MSAHGWYGPAGARRWHYIGQDGHSLCGKWIVPAWNPALVNRAAAPAVSGECVACARELETSGYVTQDVYDLVGVFGATP